jgi:hypothetical protein
MILRAGGGLPLSLTCNLQMSESTVMVHVHNILNRVVRPNCALMVNCAKSLWLRLQERPDLSPLSGRQAQGQTGAVSK